MRSLNNKGMTLTELIVSIAMLSVALVLMYGLMSDLQKKKRDVDSRADDLVFISDIEQRMQDYIMKVENLNYGRGDIKTISESLNTTTKRATITVTKNDASSSSNSIEIYKNTNNSTITLTHTSSGGSTETTKWTLKDKTCDIADKAATSDTIYLVITCYNGATLGSSSAIEYIRVPLFSSRSGANITKSIS